MVRKSFFLIILREKCVQLQKSEKTYSKNQISLEQLTYTTALLLELWYLRCGDDIKQSSLKTFVSKKATTWRLRKPQGNDTEAATGGVL